MKQKICMALGLALLSLCLSACSATYNEPCSWCDAVPTKAYQTSNGDTVYVCEECSSTCMLCRRNEASHHYTSLIGEMFVCDACYQSMAG